MAFALSAKFAVAGAAVKVAPSSKVTTRRAAAAVSPKAMAQAKKYVNPVHVQESRKKLKESYAKKFAETVGVKLVPVKQSTAQKMMSMRLTTMGRKEYIPKEILFTKPSLIVGSDTRPGTNVDISITASGNISAEHCKFDADGENVTVCDLGSATGTFLDGAKLKNDECAILSPGMNVSLDVDRGITYEVVKLTEAEIESAAAPAGSSEGWRSEASIEDRQADRIAWIAAWEARMK